MPINYSDPYVGRIPYFLQEVLSTPAGGIPKNAQWVLAFEGKYDETSDSSGKSSLLPVEAIKLGVALEPRKWNIDDSIDATVQDRFHSKKGCMYIQGVQIPGESVTYNPEGTQINGYIRTNIGGGRDTYGAMQLSFLDTNISFIDNTIRAWVLATGHLGLIARKGRDNYRCNFSVFKLGVISPDVPPFVSLHYRFFGACPVSFNADEWNYSPGTAFTHREVNFLYHYYTVDSVTGNKFIEEDKKRALAIKNEVLLPTKKVNDLAEKYAPVNPYKYTPPVGKETGPLKTYEPAVTTKPPQGSSFDNTIKQGVNMAEQRLRDLQRRGKLETQRRKDFGDWSDTENKILAQRNLEAL